MTLTRDSDSDQCQGRDWSGARQLETQWSTYPSPAGPAGGSQGRKARRPRAVCSAAPGGKATSSRAESARTERPCSAAGPGCSATSSLSQIIRLALPEGPPGPGIRPAVTVTVSAARGGRRRPVDHDRSLPVTQWFPGLSNRAVNGPLGVRARAAALSASWLRRMPNPTYCISQDNPQRPDL